MNTVYVTCMDKWIRLDATEEGRALYEKLGFVPSTECMVLLKGEDE